MNTQDQLTLPLLTASLMQQNQMLKWQNTMLRDLMDHVDAVGDRLWRMERRAVTQPTNQAWMRKRGKQKRRPSHAQSTARKRSGK